MCDSTLQFARTHDRRFPSLHPVKDSSARGRSVQRRLWSGVLVLAAILTGPAPARAEMTLGVNLQVEMSALVIYCQAEIKGGMVRYRVLETWKGEYHPNLFRDRPPAGYLYTGEWHGNDNPVAGREVVFFFSAESGKINGKFSDHSTAYVVTNGKVAVPATTGVTWSGQTEEWTLADFKKAVLAAVKQQRAYAHAAAAGGWVAALAAPPATDLTVAQLNPPATPVTEQQAAIPSPGVAGANAWWGMGVAVLAVGTIIGYCVQSRRRAARVEERSPAASLS